MAEANAWLPGYIETYNRRFAVQPGDTSDAHLSYAGTPASLARTLSIQVCRTLSKNLSCQYENVLLQIKTTGTGLGLRGAQVVVHEHFDCQKELLWRKRKLTFSVQDKPVRQAKAADGKAVNARVDKAMLRRNTGHPPAANHPWRKMKLGKAALGSTV